MSAECYGCGADLVYPEGSWPIGECPVCVRENVLSDFRRIAEDRRYSDEFLGNVVRSRLVSNTDKAPS